MGFSVVDYARKKKKKETANSAVSTPTKSGGFSVRDYALAKQVPDRLTDYQSFRDKVTAYSDAISRDSQQRNGQYQDKTAFGSYYDKRNVEAGNLLRDAYNYRDYLKAAAAGGSVGQDALDDIESTINYLNTARNGLSKENEYWNQFRDETAYKAYLRGPDYANVKSADDFSEKSQYVSTANGQGKINLLATLLAGDTGGIVYKDTGYDDLLYEWINGNEDAGAILKNNEARTSGAASGAIGSAFTRATGGEQQARQMDEDEVGIFNYLYATEGKDSAYQYYDYLQNELNYRNRQADMERWSNYAQEHPASSSAFSVAMAPAKGLSYLSQAADYATSGEIDQNSPENKFSYIPSAIRESVNETVENKWGGVGSFAYNTGMSMADFLFTTAVSGGNQSLALAIMGTGAAADATISAKDRGLSDGQAFTLGTIAGAAEVVTEKVSLEALLDKTQLSKSALGYFLKNTLSEGSEEVGSDIINLLADVLVAKDKSEWQTSIDAYKEQGMSDKDALWHAVADQAANMGLDFLGGAASGGVIGGTVAGINAAATARTGAKFNAMGGEVVGSILNEGLESDPNTESYRRAQQLFSKTENGKRIGNYELGRLYRENVQAIDAENAGGDALSRAVEEYGTRGKLSNDTAEAILENPTALNTLTQNSGLNVTEEMTKSARRKAVKSAIETMANVTRTEQTTQRAAADTQKAAVQTEQPQTADTQAYHITRMQQAASTLGENGAKALNASYDGKIRSDEYYAGFASYYDAGISGRKMESVDSDYAGRLTDAQKYAAYVSGRNDAALSLKAERKAAGYAKTAGTGSGLVYDDFVREAVESGRTILNVNGENRTYLTKEDAAKINTLAQSLGVRVQFVDSVLGGDANAQITGSTVLIEKDNPNPVMFLIGHEMTHRMQELAPEEYRAFRNLVAQEESDRIQARIDSYAAHNVELTYEKALDEVAADRAGRMIDDDKVLDDFIAQHRDDRTLLQKIRDAIHALIAKLTGAEKKKAQTAEGKLNAAIRAAEKQAKHLNNQQTGDTIGAPRYSAKASRGRTIELETMENNRFQRLRQFGENLPAEWYAYTGEYFYVYSNQSYTDYDVLIKAKITEKNRADIRKFMEALEDGTVDGAEAFNSWTSDFRRGKGRYSWNRVNASKSSAVRRYDGMDVPERGREDNRNLEKGSRTGKNVKFSLKTDSTSRKLTEAQQAFFRDSEVRDDDGRLLVVHHATDADFTVFDQTRAGKNTDGNASDIAFAATAHLGFWFNTNDVRGKTYQEKALSGYLNIENPYNAGTLDNLTAEILQHAEENYNELQDRYDNLDYSAAAELGEAFAEQLKQDGYDGIMLNDTEFGGVSFVAFESNQFKNTDNQNPTNDPDIRFSLKAGTETKNAAALHEENRLLREQLKDYIALQKQNEKLQESRDYWKGQTQRTKRVTTDKKAVAAAAKELIQNYSADLAVEDIQTDLQNLYDYISSGSDGKNELTGEEVWRRAESIARDLVENAVTVDNELRNTYSDLLDYLRTTKIVFGKEYQSQIADYNDFRKRNFGRLKLASNGDTNVDQVYQEMAEMWPYFFDEARENNPADQLEKIADVAATLHEVTEVNPFSYDMEQAITGAANDILDTFFELPQTKKTFADRQAEKLEAAKAKGRQDVQNVRAQRDAKLAELREKNRERVQLAIAKERENAGKKLEKLKQQYAAKDAAGRERQKARELRVKITRHTKTLSQKLLRPTDQHHIPESLRGPVAAMLESINQESQYRIDKNGKRVKNGEGSPTKRTAAFLELKEHYAKIAQEGGDMTIDPSLLGDDAAGVQGYFDAVIAMKDIKLADMNTEQLQTVWKVVKSVEHSVNTAGKLLSKSKYAQTQELAQALSVGTSSRKAKKSLTKFHALIDLETPYTYFSHYGEAGKAIYRMLRDAQDQQQLMVNHVADAVQKIVDPKTVKELEKSTKTFTTANGEKLTLSTAQIMELYELTKRKQAYNHLLKGGVVQPGVKSAKIRRGTDSVLLTEADLPQITGTLTEEQRKIADNLQALTTGLLADYGNRASMDAYGYRKFTEKDYWPIKSAKEGLHSNIEKGGNNTRAIKNTGMAQAVTPNASNPLDLPGIFTTFANHASEMTDYASWLCTMEDMNHLFNYKFRDQEGNLTGKSIKGLLDRVGGEGSQKYWHNLMEDIQNGINESSDSPMWDIAGKTIGGFKGAAVGANIRVVIQQPTAFFRAAAVLNPQDMARGLARGVTRGNGWKKALQYSPIAMRKDTGGFDISSPHQMSETLFDNRTAVRKMNDTLSAPAGAADAVTWGRLWNACEWATAREHQGLEKGSEAFYQQTAKLFAEVIDQTQVVDGVLQRSNIMRSSNAVVKQATSFMGEPIMSLNLMMRAYDQVRYEQNSAKRGKAIKVMGRAATALVVTNVVNALAQSLIDALRDDDEDKKYWDRFRAAFTGISGDEGTPWEKAWNAITEGNVGDNMNPLGQIPFVKDVFSLIQGYDVSRTEMEIVNDLVQAGQTAVQSIGGNGAKTRAYAVKGLIAAAAKLFGIPASNLARDMWAITRSAAVETDNVPLQYEMEKAIYNITNTGNKNRYYSILYRALEQGDMDTYQHIRKDLIDNMGVDGTSIDSAMRSRYNTAREKNPDYTLPQHARDLIGSRDQRAANKEPEQTYNAGNLSGSAYQAYSDQRADDYRSMADSLEGSPLFREMDDATKDKVLKAVYDLADEKALEDNSGGKYTADTKWITQADDAEAIGIDPWEYALFHVVYGTLEGDKDEDGKTIKGEAKSDHVREWLEDSGLTDAQQAYLWSTKYKSDY